MKEIPFQSGSQRILRVQSRAWIQRPACLQGAEFSHFLLPLAQHVCPRSGSSLCPDSPTSVILILISIIWAANLFVSPYTFHVGSCLLFDVGVEVFSDSSPMIILRKWRKTTPSSNLLGLSPKGFITYYISIY